MIRKTTLSAATNDHAVLAQAEARLNQIIAAPGNDGVKRAAQQLLGFVDAHFHHAQRREELAHAVMIPTSGEVFQQNVSDYIWMFDHSPSDDQYYSDDLMS